MIAYSYNDTGQFTCTTECRLDPLETELQEKNVWLLPGNATFIPVPIFNAEIQTATFDGEKWIIENIPEPPVPLASEKRSMAYATMLLKEDGTNLITWNEEAITVDQANVIYLEYFAEASARASEIQTLIIAAKAYIRELYPD